MKSAVQTLSCLNVCIETDQSCNLLSSLEVAHQVADCSYESGTYWGSKVGWLYGSATEDVITAMKIHARGWKSIYFDPNPPAFLGCAPSCGPTTMVQTKRWTTGLLEILLSKNAPLIDTLTGKLKFRQCLAYLWFYTWGLTLIPELCYAILPAYCIISNSSFLPKVNESAILIPFAFFVIYNLSTLLEYFQCDLSIHAWWNNQRMARINSTCASLFGLFSIILKHLGLSETIFELTHKEQPNPGDDDRNTNIGRFTFDESLLFVPGTTIVLMHMVSLAILILRFQSPFGVRDGAGTSEFLCSAWVMLMFSPFLKGLFGNGKYGIPTQTLCKSAALTLFLCTCIRLYE